ncbi:MAG: YciI family protein [Bacteroidota bacterium]
MKNYVFVILKTGPAVIEKKETRDSLFAGHMKNINRLAGENKLIVAGPFGKNDLKYRGLFILDVKTIEEAKELVNTDPAVAAKIFDVELIPWYGSAALKEYLKTAEKITKHKPYPALFKLAFNYFCKFFVSFFPFHKGEHLALLAVNYCSRYGAAPIFVYKVD